MRKQLLTISFTLLLLFSCSKEGYVEVQNRSGAPMEEVSVGENISLGSISTGANKVEKTDKLGTYHITFKQNGKTYKSKSTVKIDARTGATFTYRDSNDVTVVE